MVTRGQLLAAGFGRNQIAARIASGALIPVHRGVYVVVHASSPLAYECAAILACRPRALLSHGTAARLWNLPTPKSDEIHVTVVGRHRRSLDGVRVHYLTHLLPHELRRHAGIPIASPSLTLLDLARTATPEELAKALNEARVQCLVTDAQLEHTLTHHPKRRGAKPLRRLLDSERGPQITRSEAERRALALMRAHGIEPDETDFPIGSYRVDFLFRAERLVVEVDGYRYHGTPHRFVSDRRRIAALGAMGYQVHPLTWDDIVNRSGSAMRDLRLALARRRTAQPVASSPRRSLPGDRRARRPPGG